MDSWGEFHKEEKDGKLFLVYHHPNYRLIPTTSGEAASHDQPLQPFFSCPLARVLKVFSVFKYFIPLKFSPVYVPSPAPRSDDYHHVLPLYWCNNKEFDVYGCGICRGSNFSTDYYFCEHHGQKYHKECVESPLQLKHPYHPEHPLKLYFNNSYSNSIKCYCCGRAAEYLVYFCTICKIFMHPSCAMKPILFVIGQPKRHDHPLTLFPRQASLTCNVCGFLRKNYPTYVCLECNFVAHSDCMYSPHIIKISRHHHRVSYISSLQSGEWSCGVCRQSIDGVYGAYACGKCSDYAIHSRCALGEDVWDGEELEGVPEEDDDLAQDDGPFDMISQGVILHFLHDHHRLQLKVSIVYDEKEFCQACALPIYEGNFYSCMECHFVLHETCAKTPRRIQHGLHPHPLTFKAQSSYCGAFVCNACDRTCCGFVYECHTGKCDFDLDIRCALISEPFNYKVHEHPLFLTLDPKEKPLCQVCKSECKRKQLNCIKCNFIVCFKCATLPYNVRHTHDKHFLTFLCGKEIRENDWCEVCEGNLGSRSKEVFYWCNECCNIYHVECLIGEDPYMKPGQFYTVRGKEFQILCQSNLSRPLCHYCKNRCQGKIFKTDNRIACSVKCGLKTF